MITLSRSVYDELLAHAIEGEPREVCGVLGGEYGEEESHAVAIERTENAAAQPRSTYRIDPEEQLDVMDSLEAEGHDIVGFYHSHPAGPPGPSRTDVARASWSGYSYVIAVLDGEYPHVGSWRWNGERFERETVAVR